jgi:hypothetical protein
MGRESVVVGRRGACMLVSQVDASPVFLLRARTVPRGALAGVPA